MKNIKFKRAENCFVNKAFSKVENPEKARNEYCWKTCNLKCRKGNSYLTIPEVISDARAYVEVYKKKNPDPIFLKSVFNQHVATLINQTI